MEVFSQKSVSVALDIIEANCTRAYIERYALELGLVTGNLSSKKVFVMQFSNDYFRQIVPLNKETKILKQKNVTLLRMPSTFYLGQTMKI